MKLNKFANLQREIHPMPGSVRKALADSGLMVTYRARPAYQQNDYIGWIIAAKQDETRAKRLAQMLDELKMGGVYMRMKWGNGRRLNQ